MEDAPIALRMFELYAKGGQSLQSVQLAIKNEFGKTMSKGNVHLILKNRFYVGFFQWGGRTFPGKHDTFISNDLFTRAQQALATHNRPRYSKHDVAFRGLMRCAHDGCQITADVKKGKYTYYRCTGYRGKCALPRFTEDQISNRLGEVFESIRIPDDVLAQISGALEAEEHRILAEANMKRIRIEQRLATVRGLMDRSYEDKLNGTIPEDFWLRKMAEWREQETELLLQLKAMQDSTVTERRLSATRCLELANKAHFLYKSQSVAEQAKLLRMVLSNCKIDAVSLRAEYTKPFDLIFKSAQNEKWSGRLDSNQRPPAPEAGALPGCATPRSLVFEHR